MIVESRFRVQLLCRHGPSSRSTLFLGEACFSHIWIARVLVLRQRLQLFRDAVFNHDQALKLHRSRLKLRWKLALWECQVPCYGVRGVRGSINTRFEVA
jgi:hypothetical protein